MPREWTGVVEAIKRTRRLRGRDTSGMFSIEGFRLHERAVRSGHAPREVIFASALEVDPSVRVAELFALLREAGCVMHAVPTDVVEELTEGRGLGDIVGLVPVDDSVTLGAITAKTGAGDGPLVVAVDIFDSGNCGALVRTALAGGAAGLIAVGKTDPYHPRAVQTSMGSLFKLPIVKAAEPMQVLETLRNAGWRLAGMSCNADFVLAGAGLSEGRVAVVLGSEAFGLQSDVQSALDVNVRIPMPDGVDSFSVNAAAAIVLYEINRSRPR